MTPSQHSESPPPPPRRPKTLLQQFLDRKGIPSARVERVAKVSRRQMARWRQAVTDIRLRQRFNTTIRLPGYGGANNDTTAVDSFVAGNNAGADVSSAHNVGGGGGGFVGGAACPTP